ncbi:MAG TPA: hypothetical protein VNZ22_15400, partial [Bacillota bacterium]|nr:hypothetical protein [Bacillota bacterium]
GGRDEIVKRPKRESWDPKESRSTKAQRSLHFPPLQSRLYSLAEGLRRQILRETGELQFSIPTSQIPHEEFVDQVQDWTPWAHAPRRPLHHPHAGRRPPILALLHGGGFWHAHPP